MKRFNSEFSIIGGHAMYKYKISCNREINASRNVMWFDMWCSCYCELSFPKAKVTYSFCTTLPWMIRFLHTLCFSIKKHEKRFLRYLFPFKIAYIILFYIFFSLFSLVILTCMQDKKISYFSYDLIVIIKFFKSEYDLTLYSRGVHIAISIGFD